MFLLFVIVVSLAGVIAAFILPEWSDLLLIAGPSAIASLILWLRASPRPGRAKKDTRKWLVLDGSNIMHWKKGTPRIETIREVVRHVSTRGFTTIVVFDANAGYLIAGNYLHDSGFARLLELPAQNVIVVPKGSPADPIILDAARNIGGQVVTNDRFRDWAENYPEVGDPGFLIRGGYRSGRLWLNLDAEVSQ